MFKGIFGQKRDYRTNGPYGTPGIGDGLPGVDVMQEQPRPGFFQRDSTHDGLATFADTLVKLRSGVDPGLMRGREQQQQMQFARDRYEQRRADDQNDWIAQEQWKRDNPAPQAPTAQQRNFEYYQGMDDAGRQAFEQYLDAVTPKLVTGADGRTYPVRRPGARPAVGSVIKDPRKAGSASAPGNFQR